MGFSSMTSLPIIQFKLVLGLQEKDRFNNYCLLCLTMLTVVCVIILPVVCLTYTVDYCVFWSCLVDYCLLCLIMFTIMCFLL